MFHTEKQPGIIKARGLLYMPSLVTTRKVGIRPPPKNMVIKKYMFRYFRPARPLKVRGNAEIMETMSINTVVVTTYITELAKVRHICGFPAIIWYESREKPLGRVYTCMVMAYRGALRDRIST
jgi:hypothetical protein